MSAPRRVSSTKGRRIILTTPALPKGKACERCKFRKVRCDGNRPSCNACRRTARFEGRDESTVVCTYKPRRMCASRTASSRQHDTLDLAAGQQGRSETDGSLDLPRAPSPAAQLDRLLDLMTPLTCVDSAWSDISLSPNVSAPTSPYLTTFLDSAATSISSLSLDTLYRPPAPPPALPTASNTIPPLTTPIAYLGEGAPSHQPLRDGLPDLPVPPPEDRYTPYAPPSLPFLLPPPDNTSAFTQLTPCPPPSTTESLPEGYFSVAAQAKQLDCSAHGMVRWEWGLPTQDPMVVENGLTGYEGFEW